MSVYTIHVTTVFLRVLPRASEKHHTVELDGMKDKIGVFFWRDACVTAVSGFIHQAV